MKSNPLSINVDKDLRRLLSEGSKRTGLNQGELLRRALRLHLSDVIQQEVEIREARITALAPWPRGALAKAYKRVEKCWNQVESTATAAQARPASNK